MKDSEKKDNEKHQTMQADEVPRFSMAKSESKSLAAAAVGTVTPAVTLWFPFTLTPGRGI